ncbi:hypothetical protein FT663_00392 [Candidozyma haemuli var. vulneris]|uniref:Enoyl reductase (ER) domain-containing protein n=1 Tax=Candidozyma haemuli TaxID=45357 RepID=A0A2V1AUZ4_9ASCO|nr:hypothetical protein CXQ85_000642 [[Candida] haemuloni]KAF3988822.1 hypothetical protein FT662_03200 [[Candida] haemuloni var. vulneris]KAF3995501.1 hypothetical protein FT663_00392 [[Candida] haemuloni var. vulneris]PVH21658.1 hypothetical protein CXQ85_000642 [[Candida] haemuloni]
MPSKIILETPPTGEVNLAWGQGDSTFKLTENDLPTLNDGDVRVKVLYLSNDPTQRGWIAANQDASRTYFKPIEKGEIIQARGIGKILESKSAKYAAGDYVSGSFGWADEQVVPDSTLTLKLDPNAGLPLPTYLATLGSIGLTAYFGLKEVGKLQKGQSVLISAASGATGSTAVQLAKHLFGASKVYGIAGSDEKARWVESLGADKCVNYKNPGWKEELAKEFETVDVYFDNVGGETLSWALTKVTRFGRVIACGAIAGYNDPTLAKVTTWREITSNRLTVQGFIVIDFKDQFQDAIAILAKAIKEGSLKADEAISVVDLTGEEQPLKSVPVTWHKLFTDKPRGKLLTKIGNE